MFVRVLIVVAIVLLLWSVVASGSEGAGRPQLYTVRPYDTLWSIAVSHYAGDPREAIWELQRRNGLESTLLTPGQKLVLP